MSEFTRSRKNGQTKSGSTKEASSIQPPSRRLSEVDDLKEGVEIVIISKSGDTVVPGDVCFIVNKARARRSQFVNHDLILTEKPKQKMDTKLLPNYFWGSSYWFVPVAEAEVS